MKRGDSGDGGSELVELTDSRKALDKAGAKTEIVAPKTRRSWKFAAWVRSLRSTCRSIAPKRLTLTHCRRSAA
jgi:hypothetical protein